MRLGPGVNPRETADLRHQQLRLLPRCPLLGVGGSTKPERFPLYFPQTWLQLFSGSLIKSRDYGVYPYNNHDVAMLLLHDIESNQCFLIDPAEWNLGFHSSLGVICH